MNSGARSQTPRLAMRCDGDEVIGLGHVKRCSALIDWVPGSNRCGIFLRYSSPAAERILQDACCEIFRVDGSYDEDAAKIAATGAEWVVMDTGHGYTRRRPDDLMLELAALRRAGLRVLFFDGIGEDAILDGVAERSADCVARPYVGAEPTSGSSLAGPEYFILSRPMAKLVAQRRAIARQGRRVFVTTGGADIGAVAPLVIAALDSLQDSRFDVRVAIGPAVTAETVSATRDAAANSRHGVQLLEDCTDLTEHMLWSDAAVATSGLTKYELAATGTPALLISPDARHHELNRPFAGLSCAADMGAMQNLSNAEIANRTRDLLGDHAARQTMSDAGKKLVDGGGAERILQTMWRISDAG